MRDRLIRQISETSQQHARMERIVNQGHREERRHELVAVRRKLSALTMQLSREIQSEPLRRIADLEGQLAIERDPGRRLCLRLEVARIRASVAQMDVNALLDDALQTNLRQQGGG